MLSLKDISLSTLKKTVVKCFFRDFRLFWLHERAVFFIYRELPLQDFSGFSGFKANCTSLKVCH